MKYNNGDMDDLFRRASEGYPLRTDGADWDRLAGALDGEPAAPAGQEEKRRRRGVFWWFLLIPLVGVGYLTWQVGVHHSSERGVVAVSGGAGVAAARSTGRGAVAESGGARGEEVRKMRIPADSGASVGDARRSGMGSKPGGEGVGTTQTASGLHGRAVRGLQNAVGSGATDVDGSRSGDKSVSDGGKVRSLRTRDNGGAKVGGAKVGGADAAGDDRDPELALLDLRRASIGGGYHVVVDVKAPKAAAGKKAPGGTTRFQR